MALDDRSFAAHHRQPLHAFRALDAFLAIRDYRLAPQERICPFCAFVGDRIIEDEYHLVIECPLYDSPRATLLDKIGTGQPEALAACTHAYDLYGLILSPRDKGHFLLTSRFLLQCIGLRTMAPNVLLAPAAPLPATMSTGMRELPWIRTTRDGPSLIHAALQAAREDAPGQPRTGTLALRMSKPAQVWLDPLDPAALQVDPGSAMQPMPAGGPTG